MLDRELMQANNFNNWVSQYKLAATWIIISWYVFWLAW